MSEDTEDYDVVVDVLTNHKDILHKLTMRNMNSEYVGLNIMDDIRLEQIAEIDECLRVWNTYKNKKNYDAGYTGGPVSDGGMDPRNG